MKNKGHISDDYFEFLLKQALDDIAEEDGARLMDELDGTGEADFSDEYKKAIDDIINKKNKKRRFKTVKAAVISLFVFCGVFAFAYNVDADLRVFVNKIFTDRGTQLDIGYTELPLEYDFSNIPESWEEFYVPEYIPAGYRVEYIDAYKDSVTIVYSCNGNKLYFSERNDKEIALSFDLEHTAQEEININGNSGLLIIGENRSSISWEERDLKFIVLGSIERDEIIKIAKSIKIINRL